MLICSKYLSMKTRIGKKERINKDMISKRKKVAVGKGVKMS